MTAERRPIAIDLFCGAGGMSLGFEQAGFDVVAAFDAEQRHVDVHNLNFPSCAARVADLSKASAADLWRAAVLKPQRVDVVFGGPPCQGFSTGGRRRIDDPRNELLLHFARLVGEFRPSAFVMENVAGLMQGAAKDVLARFIAAVEAHGYRVVQPVQTLNAADYGVPQRRVRTFVLGARRGVRLATYPSPQPLIDNAGREYRPTVADALSDLPRVEEWDYLFESDVFNGSMGTPSHYAKYLRGLLREKDDRSSPRSRPDNTLTGCSRTRHAAKIRRRFAKTVPGGVEPTSRYFRLQLTEVAPTIRAGTGRDHGSHTAPRPIHPSEARCITTREAARLHGFPDWFQFHSTRWHAFRQIGNSVPPRLARAVAQQIYHAITSKR